MSLDAKSLRDFYRTPLGRLVRRQLAPVIRKRWKSLEGLTVAGSGFAAPFLGSFRTEAARLACLMPARQGALVWPHAGHCHSVLVGETQWPLPDNSVDRLLAIHCLEQAERVGPLLREMWRVLKPDGRMLIVVPNRRGLWSRIDMTPFGHGLPFSRGQLEAQLTDAMFTPGRVERGAPLPAIQQEAAAAHGSGDRTFRRQYADRRCGRHRGRGAQRGDGGRRRRSESRTARDI